MRARFLSLYILLCRIAAFSFSCSGAAFVDRKCGGGYTYKKRTAQAACGVQLSGWESFWKTEKR